MNDKRKIPFDAMPTVVADLVKEVQALSEQLTELGTVIMSAPYNIETSTGRVVYTTDQVSRIIHKTRGTIYRLVGQGKLPGYKNGKNLLFYEDEIIDWLEQSKKQVGQDQSAMRPNYQ